MSYRKHLMTRDELPSELYKATEVGTNLAEVGTDVPDINVGELISREQAIDAFNTDVDSLIVYGTENAVTVRCYLNGVLEKIKQLPPVQPDKDKVSDLLYHIYSIQSPHLDMTGVVAKKYYCEELWKELFGKESELPRWMN